MDKLVTLLTKQTKNRRHDDDFVDRLHHFITVSIIVVFTVFLGMRQYIGTPITCWAPKHFTGSHTKFTNSYCWVKNTYWLDFDEEIPEAHEADKRHEIIYYQYITFILLFQAACFYGSHFMWRSLNSKSGVDSDDILAAADKYDRAEDEDRKRRLLQLLRNQIDRFINNPNADGANGFSIANLISRVCCLCGRRFGNYLNVLYFCCKLLSIGNILWQMWFVSWLLKTDYATFGYDILQNLLYGTEFLDLSIFPRVTMCDFYIRLLGNVQRYTVQCVLPLNLYIEKVYVFLWMWFAMLLVVTVASLVMYLIRMLFFNDRLRFVRNHLKMSSRQDTQRDRQLAKEFVNFYLRQDGVFLLRMISHNTNRITTNEIVAEMWDRWLESRPDLLEEKPPRRRSDLNAADTLPLMAKKRKSSLEEPECLRPRGLPPPPPASAPTMPSAPTLDDVDSSHQGS